MPHVPASPHADHDRLLVATYAAGDATGAELETAQALVATCADCAALHRDLRTIAGAVAALPAPVRSRDFRLSPEQAARLQPSPWRRLLAPFAGPRFAFAGPLGTGLATLGIAGLLVAGSLGAPLAAMAPTGGGAQSGSGVQAPVAPAGGAPAIEPEAQEASPGAPGFKGLEQASPIADAGPAGLAGNGASEAPDVERITVGEAPADGANAGTVTPAPDDLSAGDGATGATSGTVLPLLSVLALAAGLLLAALRLAGRRLGVRA
jgi:hypothetical protein